MPDINDIHKFYEANIPEYKRRHVVELNRFLLGKMGLLDKKPINEVLKNFEWFKEWVCFEWQGYDEVRTNKLPKYKSHNVKSENKMSFPKITDTSLMPWGKHKGVKMANIPPDYLLWLLDNDKCSGQVKEYIIANKSFLELESKTNKKNQNR